MNFCGTLNVPDFVFTESSLLNRFQAVAACGSDLVASVASAAMPEFSKFVEWAESFHAVEFFRFPVHGQFEHGQTIGGGVEQFPLRGRAQIRRGFRAQFIRQGANAGNQIV